MGMALELLGGRLGEIARELVEVKGEQGDELLGLCPFHDDKNASFAYNTAKDAFNCLACGAAGDLVALWCHVHGCDPKAKGAESGVAKFKAAFGLTGDGSSPAPPFNAEKPKRPPVRKVADATEEKLVDESRFIAMNKLDKGWIERLGRERGWSPAVIDELDLRQYGERDPRIAIPVRNIQGSIVNIRLYKQGASQRETKMLSWSEKRGEKKVTFGSARLFPSPAQWFEGRVWLCEGEPDVICALSAGLNAVTQTGGASSFKKEFLQEFKGREVVIAYDADQPGIAGARKAAEKLKDYCKLVRVIEWPACMADEDGSWPEKHGQDLTDFFQKHGKCVADLENLLATAEVFEREPEPEMSDAARRFFYGRKFKPKLLADAIQDDLTVLADPMTSQLYRWTGKHYQLWHFERLEAYALKMLLDEGEPARATSAARMVYLQSLLPDDQEMNNAPEMLCLENGMVDISREQFGRFVPHDKKYCCTQIMPYRFDESADCPRWLQFLEEVVPDIEVRAQLQEFFGYCFTRETRYEKALILKGPGSDGKSKILAVLQNLVGLENCSAVQMGRLEDPFERATIYNKLLNVAAEEDKKAFGSSWVKAIVSGDRIGASFKHKDFFEFNPYCKLAFATNFWPAVTDNTEGFWRRILPIEFIKQFGPKYGTTKDTHLEEKLLAELPGIFLWAMAGLQMLREKNGFTESELTDRILRQYQEHNNPVLMFVEDHLIVEAEGKVAVDAVYKKYAEVVRHSGNYPLSKQNLGQALKAEVAGLKTGRLSASDTLAPRARAYVGIRFRNEGELHPPVPPLAQEPLNGMNGERPSSVRAG